MVAGDGSPTLSDLASTEVAVPTDLPSAAELARLPANHRRVVAALLATFCRHAGELSAAGRIAATPDAVRELVELARSLGPSPTEERGETLRQALLVQIDDIEPARLAGYGPLESDQQGTLGCLVAALRAMLRPPDA